MRSEDALSRTQPPGRLIQLTLQSVHERWYQRSTVQVTILVIYFVRSVERSRVPACWGLGSGDQGVAGLRTGTYRSLRCSRPAYAWALDSDNWQPAGLRPSCHTIIKGCFCGVKIFSNLSSAGAIALQESALIPFFLQHAAGTRRSRPETGGASRGDPCWSVQVSCVPRFDWLYPARGGHQRN